MEFISSAVFEQLPSKVLTFDLVNEGQVQRRYG